jgi:hypothetical protein
MPGHRANIAKWRLATLLGWSWIIFALVTPAGAEVVNFKELLPFVDMKIPGWTMEGSQRHHPETGHKEARVRLRPVPDPEVIMIWGKPFS